MPAVTVASPSKRARAEGGAGEGRGVRARPSSSDYLPGKRERATACVSKRPVHADCRFWDP